MLRYIKVNNAWIDSLAEQRDNRLTYMVIEGIVICIDKENNETTIGRLQEEKDYVD